MFLRIGVPLLLLLVGLNVAFGQNGTTGTTTTTTTTPPPTTTTTTTTTTTNTATTTTSAATTSTTTASTTPSPVPTPPPDTCESKNGTSCDECLVNVTCLWCIKTKTCMTYPVSTILPPHSLCPLNEARWGQCSINFQTLIIAMAVVGGVIILAFFVCLFCCCKCENVGTGNSEAKMARQADKRKVKSDARKGEMKKRHDEIRQKYGLSRASPYARFDNDS